MLIFVVICAGSAWLIGVEKMALVAALILLGLVAQKWQQYWASLSGVHVALGALMLCRAFLRATVYTTTDASETYRIVYQKKVKCLCIDMRMTMKSPGKQTKTQVWGYVEVSMQSLTSPDETWFEVFTYQFYEEGRLWDQKERGRGQ